MCATLWYLNMCVAVVLQCVAVVLQCVVVSLQDATGVRDSVVFEHVCCSVLQCVSVVLQCVALSLQDATGVRDSVVSEYVCCSGVAVVLQWCCSNAAVCSSVAPGCDGCARLSGTRTHVL